MKSSKRLLITGSAGMLGSCVIQEIGEFYETYSLDKRGCGYAVREEFIVDITDFKKVRSVITSLNPDCVVHCAAITNVDFCEENPVLAHSTNALATKNIADTIGDSGKLIYISTDSVFNGLVGGYMEEDAPAPLNNYAKAKLEGEYFVKQLANNHLIVRTNIFGRNRMAGKSFAEWIIKNLSDNKQIQMFTDVIFSPINIVTLARYIHSLFSSDVRGVLNIGSADAISKYDFGLELAALFGLDCSLIRPVSISEFSFKANRPRNTVLNISRATNIFGRMPTVREEIKKLL